MTRDGTYKPKGHTIVTVPLEPELHRRLRVHCAGEGRTVKFVVTKAIEQLLSKAQP